MSKIGKKPILIPNDVEVELSDGAVTVKGPQGEQQVKLSKSVTVEKQDNQLKVSVARPAESGQRALWGTARAILQNAITGVATGFQKQLEVKGVGYRAAVSGDKLGLNVGYSHPIELAIPKGLSVKVEKNIISVSGIDKAAVGEFAAIVRSQRKPEPYKGKGIKYIDEVIRRKAGKVVKAAGA